MKTGRYGDGTVSWHDNPQRVYAAASGYPNGVPENTSCCITKVYAFLEYVQCSRKRGHGRDGLYCWQHGKTVEVNDETKGMVC